MEVLWRGLEGGFERLEPVPEDLELDQMRAGVFSSERVG